MAIDYTRPIYDPFLACEEGNYYPADDRTLRLVLIRQIYSDIERLHAVAKQVEDRHAVRLLAKYALIEWFSLNEHLLVLFNAVLRGGTDYSLAEEQVEAVTNSQRKYRRSTKQIRDQFKGIRDKVAAHRDASIHLAQVAQYWDALVWRVIAEACSHAAEAFNMLKSLNVYRWTIRGTDDKGNEAIGSVSPFHLAPRSDQPGDH